MELLKKHQLTLLGVLILAVTMSMSGRVNELLIGSFPLIAIGYLTAYVLIGGDVAMRAFRNVLTGEWFDENFLMTIATFGAFALGEYVEAVAVMLFYKIGEGFQDYAVDHTRRSIKSLINIKAEYANLITSDTSMKVDPKALNIGDMIVIKPGEKIPVDAIIVKGSSAVDTSALTGESMPVNVGDGDELLSGSINLDASITAKATKQFKDSTVAKILDMVENATGKKAKTEQFITKFAKVYTPVVVGAALLLAVTPPLLGLGTFSQWVSRALIFLVISCPCALVLSIPLGYFGGIGAASRYGVLIKGGNYLEALNSIDTFVFDKTGTLTKGNFAVVETTGDETLELAAKIEVHSNHPIGQSIVKAYESMLAESINPKDNIPKGNIPKGNIRKRVSLEINKEAKALKYNDVTHVKEIPGQGLLGIYNDKTLAVGNSRLMEELGIKFKSHAFVGSVVHVGYDNQFIGSVYIADEIKAGTKELIGKIKEKGAKVIMLTGDQKEIADHVGNELGIDWVYSQLLPGDKLEHVESLINQGGKVLLVGDGINDAPVLARADIGVAMGGVGSDAAIEAADMVIMNDDPYKILTSVKIAKQTRNIVMQNIIFALGIKLFFLSLGAIGQASMYEAIFADVGVALIAVFNSMRTLRIKKVN